MKARLIYLFVLFMFFGVNTSIAQFNPEAKKALNEGEKLIEEKKTTKGVQQLIKSYQIEEQSSLRDRGFLANTSFKIGGYLHETGNSKNIAMANAYFSKAFFFCSKERNKELAIKILDLWTKNITIIENNDIPLPQDWSVKEKDNHYFSILSYIKDGEKRGEIEINAGSNQGLFVGSEVYVLTKTKETSDARNNQWVAKGVVVSVKNNKATLSVVKYGSSSKKYSPQIGDHAYVQVKQNKRAYKGMFYKLSGQNMHFLEPNKNNLIGINITQQFTTKEEEEMLVQLFLDLIQNTAKNLIENNDTNSFYLMKRELKRFGNVNIIEAMQATNKADIRASVRTATKYFSNYMGNKNSFAYYYMTWLYYNWDVIEDKQNHLVADLKITNDLDKWTKENQYYILGDTNLKYRWLKEISLSFDQDSTSYAQANLVGKKMLDVSKKLGENKWSSDISYAIGTNLFYQKQYIESIQYYSSTLSTDSSNSNAAWYRGLCYEQINELEKAIEDFKRVIAKVPLFAATHGKVGRYLLDQGKFKKASTYINQAYKIDPNNVNWVKNKAHLELLMFDLNKAKTRYNETLGLIQTKEQYEKDLLGDLKMFLENGWSEDKVQKIEGHIKKEYQEHFQYKIFAKELTEQGNKLYELGKIDEAIKKLKQAIIEEHKGRSVNYYNLRYTYDWLGYVEFTRENYEISLKHYKEAWQLSVDKLNNLNLQVSCLNSIIAVYHHISRDSEKKMFEEIRSATKRKIHNEQKNRTLYAVLIGKNLGGYQLANNDVQELSSLVKKNADLLFDSLVVYSLFDTSCNYKNISDALIETITKAQAQDALLFYFAGNADEKGYYYSNTSAIQKSYLNYFLEQCQANNQVVILDAPNQQYINSILEKSDYNSVKNRMVLESGISRIELPNSQNSLLCNSVLKGLIDVGKENKDGLVSIKSLENYVLRGFKKEQLSLQTYFSGVDFNISRTINLNRGSNDNHPPRVMVSSLSLNTNSRGGKVNNLKSGTAYIVGKGIDPSGVKEISVDGLTCTIAKNGKFTLSNFSPENKEYVIVKSEDNFGNIGIDTVLFSDYKTSESHINFGKGTKYALLIGSDIYEHTSWSKLSNPVRDVEAIGKILKRDYGFEVQVLKNKTKKEIQNAIYTYVRKDYDQQDQLFVFIAGHGMYDKEIGGHVVCRDSKDPKEDLDTYLPYWFFTNSLNRINSCNNIFLSLDVCFGGGFFDQQDIPKYYGSRSEVSRKEFIQSKKSKKTRLFLTSGGMEYVPDGVAGGHSPFAYMFIEALESHGGEKKYLTVSDITNYLGKLTTQPKYGRFGDNELGGDFIFEVDQEKQGQTPTGNQAPGN